MDSPILAAAIQALNSVLLRQDKTDYLEVVGTVPDWFQSLLPANTTRWSANDLDAYIPFLGNFLIDARDFWASEDEVPCKSGLWVEVLSSGEKLPLEAIALKVQDFDCLLIHRLGLAHEEKSEILQRARERTLENERLLELQKALTHEKQRFQLTTQELETTVNALPQVVCLLDVEGNILRANHTAEQWGLVKPSGNSGIRFHHFLHPNCGEPNCYLNQFCKEAWSRLDQGLTTQLEIEDTFLKRHLFLQACPIVERPPAQNLGGASYTLIVIQDTTEQKRAEAMQMEVTRLRSELQKEYAFDNIIGRGKKMREIYALMEQTATNNVTLLIQGESGTGKELVARAIHFNGSRKRGPFVTVNCAAIPETLIESELFGHERGAFTGATMRRLGKFEQAQNGTIFLDEIGEMAFSLQSKLLRVLQEREIQRVGGSVDIPIDVRVIAATNRDLEVSVKTGEFREDLFYRISVFPITVPPLRERREDIPVLAEHFAQTQAQEMDKQLRGFAAETMQLLVNHNWPGNVRELENIIQRAILMETSDRLRADNPAFHEIRPSLLDSASSFSSVESSPKIIPLDELEKQAIMAALQSTQHNITQTAELLGINRATIYRKLRKYGLDS